MRYLKFVGGDEQAQRRYALIQLTFQRSQYRPRAVTDGGVIADVVRAVNKIGVEYESDVKKKDDDELDADDLDESKEPGAVSLGEAMRRLSDDGGSVKLETSEAKMLLSLIEATPWTPMFYPQVEDLKAWIRKSPKDRKRSSEDSAGDDNGGTEDAGSGASE